jgi:hypothetical protein
MTTTVRSRNPTPGFDPAQRDVGIEHGLQRVEVTAGPGVQPALNQVINLTAR